MDFKQAVEAHLQWRNKLQVYIKNPDKSLNPDVVCKDDQCALGKWIYASGQTLEKVKSFDELKKQHAAFHKEAARIITEANRGNKDICKEIIIGQPTNYNKLSTDVIGLIKRIESEAKTVS